MAQIPSPFTIGIIGGGQLGRMFIENALKMNVRCAVLENDEHCPAALVAHRFIKGALTDEAAIRQLAEVSDVLTYEIEHINTEALLKLEAEGKQIIPSPRVLQIIQDKGLQKTFYRNNGIPTADFRIVNNPSEWVYAAESMQAERFAAKLCKGGYDGKGVALMRTEELRNGTATAPFDAPTMIEAFVDCAKELSVIVARDLQGNTVSFPVVEMEFDPVANLVTFLFSPAEIDHATEEQAQHIAMDAITKLNGYGLFAVEMMLDKQGQILVNEIAPRPHNSGHQTIEGNFSSQYDQLLRVLTGLPLGSTDVILPSAMINVLGGEGFSGTYKMEGIEKILALPGVYVHLYEKKESRPMRKLGHITVMADSVRDVKEKATFVRNTINIVPA
jgi:5-(carboxyamino)imidazole ribonucleotide synthase